MWLAHEQKNAFQPNAPTQKALIKKRRGFVLFVQLLYEGLARP